MTESQVPSPESTGGAGVSFEAGVVAIALARMLQGDFVTGLDAPPTIVAQQQRFEEVALDDVVLSTDGGVSGPQQIDYQVKRSFSPTGSDEHFVRLAADCHAAIEAERAAAVDEASRPAETPALEADVEEPEPASGPAVVEVGPIEAGRRRFGIASRPTNALSELHKVTSTARVHHTAEGFVKVLRKTASAAVRGRLDALRTAVGTAMHDGATDAELDTAAWRVARSLYVWQIDAEPDSEDVLRTLSRLGDLVAGETTARHVYVELAAAASEGAQAAASFDVSALRTRLDARGVHLNDSPARRRPYLKLKAVSDRLVDPASATLGGALHLPRTSLRDEVREELDAHDIVVLAGRAGVGKSVLARLVAHDLVEEGVVALFISIAGRTGSLTDLERDLGVPLADALAGAPIGGTRVLVVDGAEQALTDGARLLGAVLDVIGTENGTAPPWRVVVTARDEARATLARLVAEGTGRAVSTYDVSELNDEEIEQILAEFPRLAPIRRNPRAEALLLRRPYPVDLLVRAADTGDLPDDVLGEEHVLAIVDTRLVRRDQGGLPGRGTPHDRADIYRTLGEASVANALPIALTGTDAEARAGLASDDLITETRSRWRFGHDILTDYATAQRLLEEDGAALLATSESPRRLLRAARLRWQCSLAEALTSGATLEAWREVVVEAEALAAADGPRWSELPFESLVHLGEASGVLEAIIGDLMDDDGALLATLITVTMRRGRLAGTDAADQPRLDPTLSGPVVDLLVGHATEMPDRLTASAAAITARHLAVAGAAPSHYLERAAEVPDAVMAWAGDDQWGDTLHNTFESMALCAEQLEDRHVEFLDAHARNRPDDVAVAVEDPRASSIMATHRPDVLLALAGLYYLGRDLKLDGEGPPVPEEPDPFGLFAYRPDDEGVRDHSHRHRGHLDMWPLGNNQSNPALGPFASLLDASPSHGLRLIGVLVDAATDARAATEAAFVHFGGPGEVLHLELLLPGATEPTQFAGTASVWSWHRRTSTGPNPALSGLMALRAWGVAQIRDGASPGAVRDAIASAGSSLAFASVALSVIVDQLDVVTDEIDPFLPHPLVWQLEHMRVTQEHGGTALAVPDAHNLGWRLSDVAANLVLRGDTDRRAALRLIADDLAANFEELGPDAEMLCRRWATELDIDHYEAKRHPDGVAITVDYPEEIIQALEASGGSAAARSVAIANALLRAIQVRDGEAEASLAPQLWTELVDLVVSEEADPDSTPVHSLADALGGAAAALIVAANSGVVVNADDLTDAVGWLLDAAGEWSGAAPPLAEDIPDGDNSDRSPVSEMSWDMGVDRSAASALSVLILNADVRERAGASLDAVAAGLLGIAASPFDQTRARLASGLAHGWAAPCTSGIHEVLLSVARRMIATVGYAPIRRQWGGMARVTLPSPVENSIERAEDFTFDLGGAAPALTLAARASCACQAGTEAQDLVDALLNFDQRVWPTKYARRQFNRTGLWRHAVDAVVADRVMGGDDAALEAHLAAHESTGEELTGFLEALVARAVDEPTGVRLHNVWPHISDRLLPAFRNLEHPATAEQRHDDRDRSPARYLVEDLDRALLLVPDPESMWPLADTVTIGVRWFGAYQGQPHVADRALTFLARFALLTTDRGIDLMLGILGSNSREIERFQLLGPWLKIALDGNQTSDATTRARDLLDQLASAGNEEALAVQAELEN